MSSPLINYIHSNDNRKYDIFIFRILLVLLVLPLCKLFPIKRPSLAVADFFSEIELEKSCFI